MLSRWVLFVFEFCLDVWFWHGWNKHYSPHPGPFSLVSEIGYQSPMIDLHRWRNFWSPVRYKLRTAAIQADASSSSRIAFDRRPETASLLSLCCLFWPHCWFYAAFSSRSCIDRAEGHSVAAAWVAALAAASVAAAASKCCAFAVLNASSSLTCRSTSCWQRNQHIFAWLTSKLLYLQVTPNVKQKKGNQTRPDLSTGGSDILGNHQFFEVFSWITTFVGKNNLLLPIYIEDNHIRQPETR
jgi:hypothetical protein